jgi:hypothetical protein
LVGSTRQCLQVIKFSPFLWLAGSPISGQPHIDDLELYMIAGSEDEKVRRMLDETQGLSWRIEP